MGIPEDLLYSASIKPEEPEAGCGNVDNPINTQKALGEKMMVICWSYAALFKLGLPPQVLFHPDGYKDASEWLIEQYTSECFVGVATLQWIGLCYYKKTASQKNSEPYMHLLKWFRSE
jgi:hypothetical protein